MASQRNDAAKNVTVKHKDRILGLPGVTGIFTGEKTTGGEKTGQRSVVVSVARKHPLSAIPADERIPATLDGIPTDVIEEVFRPCDDARYDPLKGGASISVTPEEDSAFSSGTAGMIVSDVATGDAMILSCWHVLYGAGVGTDGDIVTNPPYAGGDPTPDKVGTTTRFALTSTVDGAVARALGRSASRAILDLGTPSAIAPASVDMVVRKRGATTGLTTGVVTATDWSGLIDYGPPVGVVSFENMIRFEGEPGMVLGGDSGSVLVAGEVDGDLLGVNLVHWVETEALLSTGTGTVVLDDDASGYSDAFDVDPGVDWVLTCTATILPAGPSHDVEIGIAHWTGAAFTSKYAVNLFNDGSEVFYLYGPGDSTSVTASPFSDGDELEITLSWDASTTTLSVSVDDGVRMESTSLFDDFPPTTDLNVYVLAAGTGGSGGGLEVTAMNLAVG